MKRIRTGWPMASNIPLAVVLFATVATVALRAAVRRPEPPPVPGTEPAPVTVMAEERRPQADVNSGPPDDAGHAVASQPDPPGLRASVVVQMQHVFHELHADGRHPLCAVCDGQ